MVETPKHPDAPAGSGRNWNMQCTSSGHEQAVRQAGNLSIFIIQYSNSQLVKTFKIPDPKQCRQHGIRIRKHEPQDRRPLDPVLGLSLARAENPDGTVDTRSLDARNSDGNSVGNPVGSIHELSTHPSIHPIID